MCISLLSKKSNTSNATFYNFWKKQKTEKKDGGPVCEMLNALIYFGHKCPFNSTSMQGLPLTGGPMILEESIVTL